MHIVEPESIGRNKPTGAVNTYPSLAFIYFQKIIAVGFL